MLLLMHFGLIMVVDFTDLSLGMIMIHFFTVRSSVDSRKAGHGGTDILFTTARADCATGRSASFSPRIERHDIRFAPLGGETFAATIPQTLAAKLPDSWSSPRPTVSLIFRARAVHRIASKLGGIWQLIAVTSRVMPTAVLDLGYDFVHDSVSVIRPAETGVSDSAAAAARPICGLTRHSPSPASSRTCRFAISIPA